MEHFLTPAWKIAAHLYDPEKELCTIEQHRKDEIVRTVSSDESDASEEEQFVQRKKGRTNITMGYNESNQLHLISTPKASPTPSIVENQHFRFVLAVLLLLVALVTLIGGIFFCHVVRKHQLLHSTGWFLLIFLTVSDSLNAAITIPTYIAAYIDETILHISWFCNFNTAVSIFFAHTTIYMIAAISLCRVKVIKDPYCTLGRLKLEALVGYVLFAILMSAALSMPPVLGFGNYAHEKGDSWCTFKGHTTKAQHQNQIMIYLICIFGYTLPVLVVIISSVVTFCAFHQTTKTTSIARRRTSEDTYTENWKMARLMLIVIVAFLLSWTPIVIYLFSICIGVNPEGWFWPVWGHIGHLIMFMQGIINPLVYCCKHNSFSEEVKNFLHICHRHNEENNEGWLQIQSVRESTV